MTTWTISYTVAEAGLTAGEIRALVGRDDPVIIEIGANCGQTTVELLKAMPGVTIHAFEPDPRAIAKFRKLLSTPGCIYTSARLAP